jgi:integrase
MYVQLTALRNSTNPIHVFTNPKTGKPFTKIQKSFERARTLAGIEDVRFHDLRHTFASRLIARGVDIIKVKDFLGHTSVKATEQYTHSSREERKRAIELLCEKSSKSAPKKAFVWHSRYTKIKDKDGNPVTPYFSVN